MKINILFLALFASCILVGCNKGQPVQADQTEQITQSKADTLATDPPNAGTAPTGMTVAVNLDIKVYNKNGETCWTPKPLATM